MEIKEALSMLKQSKMTVAEVLAVIEAYEKPLEEVQKVKPARKIKVFVSENNGKTLNLPSMPFWLLTPFLKMGLWMAKKHKEKPVTQEEKEQKRERILKRFEEKLEKINASDDDEITKEAQIEKLFQKKGRQLAELDENDEWAYDQKILNQIDYKAMMKELKACGPMTLVEVWSEEGDEVFIRMY